LLVIWEAVAQARLVDPRYLAGPSAVLLAGWMLAASGAIWPHLWTSFQEFFWGFSAAIVVGLAIGMAMARYRRVDYTLGPTVMALYSIPRLVFVPLILFWMGLGVPSKAMVVFLGALFPIVINTQAGLRSTDPLLIRAARSFCASELDVLRKIMLPAALPYIVAGLRLGVGRGLMGVIVAEMYVSSQGIGFLLMQSARSFRTAQLLFEVVLVAGAGILASQGLQVLERRLVRWRYE
jgi:ABC-type nitrate/sulfonate/bicarbonate transport system permease component